MIIDRKFEHNFYLILLEKTILLYQSEKYIGFEQSTDWIYKALHSIVYFFSVK